MNSAARTGPRSKAQVGRLAGALLVVGLAAWELVEFVPLMAAATAPFWQRFHAAVVLLVVVAFAVVAVRDAASGVRTPETRILALLAFPAVAGYQILWTATTLPGKLGFCAAMAAVFYLMVADFRSGQRGAAANLPERPTA